MPMDRLEFNCLWNALEEILEGHLGDTSSLYLYDQIQKLQLLLEEREPMDSPLDWGAPLNYEGRSLGPLGLRMG